MASSAAVPRLVFGTMLVGAVGLALSAVPSPLTILASGLAYKLFEKIVTDAGRDALKAWAARAGGGDDAGAASALALAAGGVIAGIVKEAHAEYPKRDTGAKWLESATRIDAKDFAACLERPEFQSCHAEALREFLGAPMGGIDEQATTGSFWLKLLIEGLATSNPAGDRSTLEHPDQQKGLRFAAKALWERFPAKFNEILRKDGAEGGTVWIEIQAATQRRLIELAIEHSESHQELKKDLADFILNINTALASLARQVSPQGEHPDESLYEKVSQARNYAGSTYARLAGIDAKLADIRDIVAGGPEILIPDDTTVDRPSMYFSDRRVPFVARDKELDELRAFLNCRQIVAWWVWHGAAGMGKSRLAFELCREFDAKVNRDAGQWTAGFLKVRGTDAASWGKWRPRRPTLIVVDYAASKAPQLSEWIADLARQAKQNPDDPSLGPLWPVRFLLLDRDADKHWLNLLMTEDEKGRRVKGAQYKVARERLETPLAVPPRALTPLDDAGLLAVAEAVYKERDAKATPDERSKKRATPREAANAIRGGPREHRPLFVTLAAEAAYDGQDVSRLNEVELVDDWLDVQREQWKKEAAGPPYKLEGESYTQLERLLALATLCQGLPAPNGYDHEELFKKHGVDRLLPPHGSFANGWAPLYKFLSIPHDEMLKSVPPMQPDYFGERFVLRVLDETINHAGKREAFLDVALEANEVGAAEYLALASRDFPQHELVLRLTDKVLPLLRKAMADPLIGTLFNAVLFSVAYSMRQAGAVEHAGRLAASLAAMNPDHATALFNNATLLGSISEREREAEAAFKQALALRPQDADILHNYGMLLAKQPARAGESVAFFERAQRADPRSHIPWYGLVSILIATVDRPRGIAMVHEEMRSPVARSKGWIVLGVHFLLAAFGDEKQQLHVLGNLKGWLPDPAARVKAMDFAVPLIYLRLERPSDPDLPWLEKLAQVISGKAEVQELDGWAKWREASPPPFAG
jgi:tetratricopeptide (TPR) repeat protein